MPWTTEKTLLVKAGRGVLVNKNFEPEDYPANGHIFNNAARHGIAFKDYGALIRTAGTDAGTSVPPTLNDRGSGNSCYLRMPLRTGRTTSKTQTAGRPAWDSHTSFPILAELGGKNADGEARVDASCPGYNFSISDQRRALESIKDFDRMVAARTVLRFLPTQQAVGRRAQDLLTRIPPRHRRTEHGLPQVGALSRLSLQADELARSAGAGASARAGYGKAHADLYAQALLLTQSTVGGD